MSPTSACPPLGLAVELGSAVGRWRAEEAHTDQTLTRMSETVHRFAQRLAATGVSSFTEVTAQSAAGFVLAPSPDGHPPEVHTQHARRTAVRVLYRTLRAAGYPVGDPTLDLILPPRGLRAARPLTIDEVTLCRATAHATAGRSGSMRACAWALGEATAVSAEITAVHVADLDHPTDPRSVSLPGTRRVRPRTVSLTRWGQLTVARRVGELTARGLGGEALLAYGGAAPPGGAKAQASVCNALRDVLDASGLAGEADVRPSSLRHWAGRTAYDAGLPLEQVAVLMGHRSLDATAEDIALDWAPATGTEVAR